MKLYTSKEASMLLGVSVKTIRRWDKSGRMKCTRYGSIADRDIVAVIDIYRKV